jgi:hypothetical protein
MALAEASKFDVVLSNLTVEAVDRPSRSGAAGMRPWSERVPTRFYYLGLH